MTGPLLKPLSDNDTTALEHLLDQAFGHDRKDRTAYKLRDSSNYIRELSFCLYDGNMLVGSIQCWPVNLVDQAQDETPLILVGPVAVNPDCQNSGYGRRLILTILSKALDMGDPPMMLIGDPQYYGLFGFSNTQTDGWNLPGPFKKDRLLARNPSGHILPQNAKLTMADISDWPLL